jgi:hypothetical protein
MQWINLDGEAGGWRSKNIPAPLLRKNFFLTKLPQKAVVRFASPGWSVISLNGKRITGDILIPSVTQLDKHTGMCEYDVTPLLNTGENVIGVLLGNGWFNCATHEVWHFDKAPWRNYNRLFLELCIGNEIIVRSDNSWKCEEGPIIFSQLRSGEHFDARNVWTDGSNIYYSCLIDHYVLNRETSTWETKAWNAGSFNGSSIWDSGTYIFYSGGNKQYALVDGKWYNAGNQWKGLTYFDGQNVWTDGERYYCSAGDQQYVLNGWTWEPITWNGYSDVVGRDIWTDGTNFYYSWDGATSSQDRQYVLNRETNTWEKKVWYVAE